MGDETDHQSVRRRLSQDADERDKPEGDHAQVVMKQQQSQSDRGSTSTPPKEWVKFEEEGNAESHSPENNKSSKTIAAVTTMPPTQDAPTTTTTTSTPSPPSKPAVLETETTHVNLQENRNTHSNSSNTSVLHPPPPSNSNPGGVGNGSTRNNGSKFPVTSQPSSVSPAAVIEIPPVAIRGPNGQQSNHVEMGQMRTIELSTGRVREGFANGDVIVTLLPLNQNLPWITPPVFRPELVPEELMAQGLTLTVEEYVHAMETLVNDYRFTMYNMCYKRILVCWILFAFGILLGLLFSGLTGITLFALGVTWLFMNMATVFLCMWVKIRLARGLEKCLARVNKQLIRHKILLVLDDRGKISCHKVNLCFIYYDAAQCVNYLNEFIEHNEQSGTAIEPGWEARLDLNTSDIVIQGANTTRVSRKQTRAENLYLRYGQRWGKDFLRRRLDWILVENCRSGSARHLQAAICPCQYVEEILNSKDLRPNCGSRLRSCVLNCC